MICIIYTDSCLNWTQIGPVTIVQSAKSHRVIFFYPVRTRKKIILWDCRGSIVFMSCRSFQYSQSLTEKRVWETVPPAPVGARRPSLGASRRCRRACGWRWCWRAAGSPESAARGSARTPGVPGSYRGSPGPGWTRGRRPPWCDQPDSACLRRTRSCDRCWCYVAGPPCPPGYIQSMVIPHLKQRNKVHHQTKTTWGVEIYVL